MANDIADIDQLLEATDKVRSSDPTKFSELLSELSTQAAQMSSQQSHYFSYLKAYKLTYSGKSKQAFSIFQNILTTDANNLIKFRSRITIINIYAIEQNWADGLAQLSILLEDLPNIKHPESYKNGLAIAAVFYNQLGQYNLGKQYADLLSSESNSEKTRQLCMAKMLSVESDFNLSRLKENSSDIKNSIDSCENEPIAANFIRAYLASYHIKNNDADNAFKLLSPYIKQIEATKYPRLIVEIYTLLANAHWLKEEFKQSEFFALKSVNLGENIKTTQAVVSAYKLLYQIAKKQQKHEKALEYHEKYLAANKAYVDGIKAKHLAFQLAEHKEFEQKSKIQLLNEQNSLLKVEQQLALATSENNRLFIVLLLTLVSLLVFFGYRSWLSQRRFQELAECDSLTNIYNRGHFLQLANSALQYCQKVEQDISLIVFDLDHFKNINDSFGHACGDWALQQVTSVCQSTGRRDDIFARVGGEEFCILLSSCSISQAYSRAEHYRNAIAAIDSTASNYDFKITASFGVTSGRVSGFDIEKLMADADSAAYDSKHAGRNKTTMYTSE